MFSKQFRISIVVLLIILVLILVLKANLIQVNQKENVTIIVAADLHYCQDNVDFTIYSDRLFGSLRSKGYSNSADLIIFNGDMLSSEDPDKNITDCVSELKEAMDSLETDYLYLMGNHELLEEGGETIAEYFGNSVVDTEYYNIEFGSFNVVGWNSVIFSPDDPNNTTHFNEYHLPVATERFLLDNVDENSFVVQHIPISEYNTSRVLEILTANNVPLNVQSHWHDRDYCKKKEGLTVCYTGRSGGSWGAINVSYRVIDYDIKNRIMYTKLINTADNSEYRHQVINFSDYSDQGSFTD